MALTDMINDIAGRSSEISLDEIGAIQEKYSPEDIAAEVEKKLEIPNLNFLKLAEAVPDKRYEPKLLSYDEGNLTEEQQIYWLLTLGRINSNAGYMRIAQFVSKSLFHQAFVALSQINLFDAMKLLDMFMSKRVTELDPGSDTYDHDSGYNALLYILEDNPGAAEIASLFDMADDKKKDIVMKALKEYKKE